MTPQPTMQMTNQEKANNKYAAFRAAFKSSMLHDKTQKELAGFKKLEKEVFDETPGAGIPCIHRAFQSCRYRSQFFCQAECHSYRRRISGNRAGFGWLASLFSRPSPPSNSRSCPFMLLPDGTTFPSYHSYALLPNNGTSRAARHHGTSRAGIPATLDPQCLHRCADHYHRRSTAIVARRKIVIQNHSTELKTMFEKCGAIPIVEKSRIFDNIGDDCYRSNTIALLITLLPNIRHIASQRSIRVKAPNGANRTKKALHRTVPRKFRSKPYGRGLAPNRTTKPWCTDSLYGVFTISCNRVFNAFLTRIYCIM